MKLHSPPLSKDEESFAEAETHVITDKARYDIRSYYLRQS